jgi:hypothetical protein
MCPTILKDGVCSIPHCRYAHNANDLRAQPGLLKTKLCSFFLSGSCVVGSACRFAHGVEELQEAAVVRKDALVATAKAANPTNPSGESSGKQKTGGGTAMSRSMLWETRRARFQVNALPPGYREGQNLQASSSRLQCEAEEGRPVPIDQISRFNMKNVYTAGEADFDYEPARGSVRRCKSV